MKLASSSEPVHLAYTNHNIGREHGLRVAANILKIYSVNRET